MLNNLNDKGKVVKSHLKLLYVMSRTLDIDLGCPATEVMPTCESGSSSGYEFTNKYFLTHIYINQQM